MQEYLDRLYNHILHGNIKDLDAKYRKLTGIYSLPSRFNYKFNFKTQKIY